MKKITKINISVVFVLLILSVGFIITKSIKSSAKGQIINSVTGEKISNVLIERNISKKQCNVGGCSWGPNMIVNQNITDNEGKFTLNSYFIFAPSGYTEYVIISAKGYYPTLINKRKNKNLEYGSIEITPETESLEECNANSLCISENSFYLAMKNNDVKLCKEISLHDKFTDNSYYKSYADLSARCIEMFAINNNDTSMCNTINEIDFNDAEWKDWKKRVCIQNIESKINISCETIKNENSPRFNYERERQACHSTFKN